MDLSADFWDNRYQSNDTGWDLGTVSPPLKAYFDQLTNLDLKILIPGGGNSYEAEYLFNNGFKNVYVVDLSQTALDNLKHRIPDFPSSNLILDNFFDLSIAFDLIIEQTFFCAINPSLRADYAKKASEILNVNGKVAGLLFDATLNTTHPPFGGSKTEYLGYFNPYFDIRIMDASYNSIKPRAGRELFFIIQKK